MLLSSATHCLLFSGCMDDIVTVLAEEHGCLDTIKVEFTSLVSSTAENRIVQEEHRFCKVAYIMGKELICVIFKIAHYF